MQILLANAKIMFDKADRKPISVPLFQSVECLGRRNGKDECRGIG